MHIPRLLFLIAMILFTASPGQSEVTLPDTLSTHHGRLILNGSGVRSKFFLDLYVGGLYLRQKESDPQKIIAADQPMAIRLHITSSLITSKKMEDATREGFEKATGGELEPLNSRIEQFIAVFKEEIRDGDVYDMRYAPGAGVAIVKNGKLYSVIPGLDFKKALFGIWLGDHPAQESLKKAMLGL